MSVYLHYLDRELGRSLSVQLSQEILKSATDVLLIGTSDQLYCGLSLLWEQPAAQPHWSYLGALVASGHLLPLSAYPTAAEFVEAKRQEYAHDEARYPAYFDDRRSAEVRSHHFRQVQSSTTVYLVGELRRWATQTQEQGRDADSDRIAAATLDVLDQRESQAVTASLFEPRVAQPFGMRRVSREISRGYTRHYLGLLQGDLPTGVAGLDYYDTLASRFPLHDFPLLQGALTRLGAPRVLPDTVVELLALRGDPLQYNFAHSVRRLVEMATPPEGNMVRRRVAARETMRRAFADARVKPRTSTSSWVEFFEQGAIAALSACEVLEQRFGPLAGSVAGSDRVAVLRAEFLEMRTRSPPDVARIFGGCESVSEFLLREILAACDTVLVRKSSLASRDENKISDLLVALLTGRLALLSWQAKDQSRGGTSATGTSGAHSGVGERDWVITGPNGSELAVIEAFILSSAVTDVINVHNLKVFKYDPPGREADFLVIYAMTSDLTGLWERYLKKVRDAPFSGDGKLLKGPVDVTADYDAPAALRVGLSTHERHGKPVALYHLFVGFGAAL